MGFQHPRLGRHGHCPGAGLVVGFPRGGTCLPVSLLLLPRLRNGEGRGLREAGLGSSSAESLLSTQPEGCSETLPGRSTQSWRGQMDTEVTVGSQFPFGGDCATQGPWGDVWRHLGL